MYMQVLFAAFKRNLKADIKVAQLAGTFTLSFDVFLRYVLFFGPAGDITEWSTGCRHHTLCFAE